MTRSCDWSTSMGFGSGRSWLRPSAAAAASSAGLISSLHPLAAGAAPPWWMWPFSAGFGLPAGCIDLVPRFSGDRGSGRATVQ